MEFDIPKIWYTYLTYEIGNFFPKWYLVSSYKEIS